LHTLHSAHRRATAWLGTLAGCAGVLLISAALAQAEEVNPNNYNCLGHISAGKAEPGGEGQQVAYSFYCNGPITGYQLQAQIPLTGIESPPLLTSKAGTPVTDTFACSGEIPGYALNCVGAAKASYETIAGQFAIGAKLCKEPRVDPLLTVTYAYLEKGAVTQAISGPFDLGRPSGCRPDAFSGSTRLNPQTPGAHHAKKKHKGHKASHRRHKALPAK
jgi:hypothetical protein